jgi:hypothetical protein
MKARQRVGRKCNWCGQQAVLRGFMFGRVSCQAHHDALLEWDRKAQAPDYSDAAFYGGFA